MPGNTGYGSGSISGLVSNTDDSSIIKGKLVNTVFMGYTNTVDSNVYFLNSFVAGAGSHFYYGNKDTIRNSLFMGDNSSVTAPVINSIISGVGNNISYPVIGTDLMGYITTTADTAANSLISAAASSFGGVAQSVIGQYLTNRTPYGTTLGLSNVDFPSLSYTGLQGARVAGISGYPLFAIGNSSSISFTSNAMTILFNGRTQINTTGYSNALTQANVTPKAALEVVSNNSGVLFANMTTVQRNAIATGDLQNGLLLYNTDSSLFQFYNGSAWSSVGSSVSIAGWDSSGNTGTNPASNFIGTTDSESLVFRTDDIVHMTILPGGAVGIGTSTLPQPDAQLAVNGTLYATKVEAIQTGWPDYVFDKGYSLPSLTQLERYIRQHRHLPGVVPAGEVAAKGIDLGENQSALLKKVEELTLYLIEAHKQSDLRQKEIDRLEKQNKSLDDHQREIDRLMDKLKKMAGNTAAAKQ
jgi:hypothetical protein